MQPGVLCSSPSLMAEMVLFDTSVWSLRFGLLEEVHLPRGVMSRAGEQVLFG